MFLCVKSIAQHLKVLLVDLGGACLMCVGEDGVEVPGRRDGEIMLVHMIHRVYFEQSCMLRELPRVER